jgi:hypothetical protein
MLDIIVPAWIWVVENRFELKNIWRYIKYENAHLN